MHTKKFIAAVIGAFLLFGTNQASIINSDIKLATKPVLLKKPLTTQTQQTVEKRPLVAHGQPAVLVNSKKPIEVSTKPALMIDPLPVKPDVFVSPKPVVLDVKLPQQASKQTQQHAGTQKQLTTADKPGKQAQKPAGSKQKKKKANTVNLEKKQWPQLKGLPSSYAKINISKTNPSLSVVIVKQGQPVTKDFNQNRVRIYVDSKQLVKTVPVRG